jgi:hypothetical protein
VLPVRYELNLYMLCRRKLTASVVWWSDPGFRTEMYCVPCEVRTEFVYIMSKKVDRLCGLVVGVPGYRSGGPGSIPGAAGFSGKWWVSNGVRSASWERLGGCLGEKVTAPV